jgi:hypothetical protein
LQGCQGDRAPLPRFHLAAGLRRPMEVGVECLDKVVAGPRYHLTPRNLTVPGGSCFQALPVRMLCAVRL